MANPLRYAIHRLLSFAGAVAAFVFLPGLIATSIFDITTRRFLQLGSTPLQELTWHFFFACVMFGIGCTYIADKHVRVDILRERVHARVGRLRSHRLSVSNGRRKKTYKSRAIEAVTHAIVERAQC